eukprot:7142133-Prymnesium_polylepis.1
MFCDTREAQPSHQPSAGSRRRRKGRAWGSSVPRPHELLSFGSGLALRLPPVASYLIERLELACQQAEQ